MRLAVIPARGGSKRISRKNIKLFHGKPIIAYSIELAQKSGLFDRVIVSTDDREIADVAREYGAQCPFIRPKNLADDHAVIEDVLRHAIDFYQQRGESIEALCCLYATAPMMSLADLQAGYNMLQHNPADVILSVTSFPFPIQRAQFMNAQGCLKMAQPEHRLTRSQDLQDSYHDAAQFIWAGAAFIDGSANNTRGLVVCRQRVQDIDTAEDWLFAEQSFLAHKIMVQEVEQ